MSHPICYAELHTTAPSVAREFYRSLFGWGMKHHAELDYTEIRPGEGPEGGLMGLAPADFDRPLWVTYVGVEDVEAASAKAVSLGAVVRVPKTEVPGAGWFAWLDDPTGARFALWQKAEG
ncbi:VOC family protein [Acidobacteria bacterium ACD]|nr:MAG: VOC family protein [Acidobacteriota bacterium]MCE7958338.1 VOC family protein [Acidobacteria bacterium ACB2]MDL1948403.1 VOC family protein [Acidobacteria bacterium ACD]